VAGRCGYVVYIQAEENRGDDSALRYTSPHDTTFGRENADVRLNYILEFGPYRKENTALHRYKDQPVNAV
jgi:hypothetical protein